MIKISYLDRTALMSPRTAKYVEAMIREGDNFDYNEWLKEVREEEAQAKRAEATRTSLVVTAIGKPMRTPDGQHPRPNPPLAMMTKTKWLPRRLLSHRQAKSRTPKARLTRWLEKVRRASGEFQGSRERDAVYAYLTAVFAIVMHYKVRRRTTRLLRHAFKFANLPFDKNANADAFSTIIRCTCSKTVDAKTISKYARALRFAAACKRPQTSLTRFVKRMGGLNTCAGLYAKHFGRTNLVADMSDSGLVSKQTNP